MRIALAQVDTTVGDLTGNVDLLTAWASRATEADADVVVFPELAITGYPPEDLVLRPSFVEDNLTALDTLAAKTTGGTSIVVGFVDRTERGIHNAAGVIANGQVIARYHKIKLPNYGVFDEARTFTPGDAACPIRLADSSSGCRSARTPGCRVHPSTSTRGGRRRSSSTSTGRRSIAARPTSASRSAGSVRSRPARGSST